MTFCGGMDEDGERKSKKNNNYIYLLTEYIKSIPWGVVVRLSYI
jgi:hypothetical protein